MTDTIASNTGVAIGTFEGTCPPPAQEPTQLLKIVPKCIKTRHSHTKKSENFLRRGCIPFLNPFPVGRGHPFPYPTPQVPPLQLDLSYATGFYDSKRLKQNDALQFIRKLSECFYDLVILYKLFCNCAVHICSLQSHRRNSSSFTLTAASEIRGIIICIFNAIDVNRQHQCSLIFAKLFLELKI